MDCLGLLLVGIIIFFFVRKKGKNSGQTVTPNQPMNRKQPTPNQPMNRKQPIPNQSMNRKQPTPNQPIYQRQLLTEMNGNWTGQEKGKSGISQQVNQRVCEQEQFDNLMQEVEDLMVKGYDGELSFSRDFVAEGIEMLNRIQL